MFKRYGSEYSERVLNLMLNIFANPAYEIDSQALMLLLESAPKAHTAQQNQQDHIQVPVQEPDPLYLKIAKMIQEVVSLSTMRDVMTTASEKEWEEAREDFLALVLRLCAILNASKSMREQLQMLPRWLRFNTLVKTALFSFPVLLTMRQKGYGHWIDIAKEKLEENEDLIKDIIASGKEWPDWAEG